MSPGCKPCALRPAAIELLRFAARWYLPFLAANARCVGDGSEEVQVVLNGEQWAQSPFKYQAKCYHHLCERLAQVNSEPLRELLAETGCLPYLQGL